MQEPEVTACWTTGVFDWKLSIALQWRDNRRDSVSNQQPHDCLLNLLFRSKKTSKLRVTGLCAGNSPGTGELPAQMASNEEDVSIWWRHHPFCLIVVHKEILAETVTTNDFVRISTDANSLWAYTINYCQTSSFMLFGSSRLKHVVDI